MTKRKNRKEKKNVAIKPQAEKAERQQYRIEEQNLPTTNCRRYLLSTNI